MGNIENYVDLGRQVIENLDKNIGETGLGTLIILGASIGIISDYVWQQCKVAKYKLNFKKFTKKHYSD